MRLMLVAMAGWLAACAPPAADVAEVEQNNCAAQASAVWTGGAGQDFLIEATASGASCAQAQGTLTIRDPAGAIVHLAIVDAADVQALAGAESVDDMGRRLGEWITPAGASMDSVGDLAAWQPGASEPSFAEVSFHPAPRVTRDIYEALRAGDGPMYCYEQNRESGVCLTLWDGVLEQIGVQTYAQ